VCSKVFEQLGEDRLKVLQVCNADLGRDVIELAVAQLVLLWASGTYCAPARSVRLTAGEE
jgi:hypothetical protein